MELIGGSWIQTVAYLIENLDGNVSNSVNNLNQQLSGYNENIITQLQSSNNSTLLAIDEVINELQINNSLNSSILNDINGKLDVIIDKDYSPIINVDVPAPIVNLPAPIVNVPAPIVNVECPTPIVNVDCNTHCTPNKPCNDVRPFKPKYPSVPCVKHCTSTVHQSKPPVCPPSPSKKHIGPTISRIDSAHMNKLRKANLR